MRVEHRSGSTAVAAPPKTFTSPGGTVYAEPAAGAPLAKGHFGERVVELQKQLNAAGLKPPLALDGLFGPKTEAALAKLTGAKTLDGAAQAKLAALATHAGRTDGFDAGQPPALPSSPAAVAPSSVGQPPASGSLAEKTLAIAQGELGTVDPRKTGADGKYVGWQKLQGIFEKTTGWRPSDKEIQASSQPQHKAWCGIFATHVLQEAGANVRWDLSSGKMVGDVDHVPQPTFRDWRTYKAERQAFESTIKPGDVITVSGKLNHHAIVTSVNADGTVNTIDGNKPHIGEGRQKLSDVTSYYRPRGASAQQTPTAPPPVPTPAGAANVEGGQTAPGGSRSIGEQFHVDTARPATKDSLASKVDLGGDKAARMKALDGFTQLDGTLDRESDLNACGATAIVAGAALEGGTAGLSKLLQVVEERGNQTRMPSVTNGWKSGPIPEWDKLAGIEERVASNSLTQQDLADLKTIVYRQLRQVEDDIGAKSTNATIDVDAVRAYLATDVKWLGVDQPLKGLFDQMNIKLVDVDGNGTGDHFVLMFNDGTGKGENAVFDPWPTKSGRQINRNQGELLWYHHAVKNAVR
ncbi:MAG: peptidoglycan-binding domain-containing protein [Myxococcota bacterium]